MVNSIMKGVNLPADVQTKWLTKFDPTELRKVTQ